MRKALFVGFITAALCVNVFSQRTIEERVAWNQPVNPFRIVGNVYYVGVSGVTSFLIATPKGAILIDGGFPETAPLIEKNISDLGFHLRDVKYLLNSHAHYDHSGGLAELKRLSGARMVASEADGETLTSGRYGPDKDGLFPSVKVDRVVGDKETVQLGDVTVTAHLTPGHTKGCTTWTAPIVEDGKTYNVVFYCSTTVAANQLANNRNYPRIASDYEHSFAELRQLPCDVFLAPHAGFFHMAEKRDRITKAGPNPFIDPSELQRFAEKSQQDFKRELKEQQAGAHP
jgi:metallo-beta-lactamase class B